MPSWQHDFKPVTRLMLAVSVLVNRCSRGPSDTQWARTVPGIYEGRQSNLREVLKLNEAGDFEHQVFDQETKVMDEAGKWEFEPGNGRLALRPFTSFCDDKTHRLTTNGIFWSVGALAVLRYGRQAERIVPSDDPGYFLIRKNRDTSSNSPNSVIASPTK